MGKQYLASLGFFIGLYIIALPLAIYFVFSLKIGIIGFWLGIIIGDVFIVFYNQFYISIKFNWEILVEEARVRMLRQKQLNEEMQKKQENLKTKENSSHTLLKKSQQKADE